MVELQLEALDTAVLPRDCFVALRVGKTQKLARLAPGGQSRVYRFPQEDVALSSNATDRPQQGKVEIFGLLGTFSVDPRSEGLAGWDVSIPAACQPAQGQPTDNGAAPGELRLHLSLASGQASGDGAKSSTATRPSEEAEERRLAEEKDVARGATEEDAARRLIEEDAATREAHEEAARRIEKADQLARKEAKQTRKERELAAAREYLQEHGIKASLAEAMQVVLRDRPEDPVEYLAEMFEQLSADNIRQGRAAATATPVTSSLTDSHGRPVSRTFSRPVSRHISR